MHLFQFATYYLMTDFYSVAVTLQYWSWLYCNTAHLIFYNLGILSNAIILIWSHEMTLYYIAITKTLLNRCKSEGNFRFFIMKVSSSCWYVSKYKYWQIWGACSSQSFYLVEDIIRPSLRFSRTSKMSICWLMFECWECSKCWSKFWSKIWSKFIRMHW